MFCSHCGNDLGNEQVCGQCGRSIGEMATPMEQPESPRVESGNAIASLVLGVISWSTLGGCFVVPLIGLVFGIWGLKSQQSGVAMAGIILNATVLIFCVLVFLLFLTFVWMASTASVSTGRCC
jgi:hypothetical protein